MGRFLLRRFLVSLVTLFGITLVTFGVSRMAPGGPLDVMTAELSQEGRGLTEESRARLEALLGLDRPLPLQYVRWVRQALTLDFGRSFDGLPVRTKIAEHLRRSLLLQFFAILVIYLVAVPIGVLSAVCHGRRGERAVTLLLFLFYSLPSFLVANLLLYVFSSGRPFQWFPMFGLTSLDREGMGALGRAADLALHLALPVVTLSYAGLAVVSRYARAGMLEVLSQDFVRTARAKGLGEARVVGVHALRLGLLPVVTLLGNLVPALFGGSVIVEQIFGIPGMGFLAIDAVLSRDYPVVMAISTLVGVATLVGYVLSDLLTSWLDPRISPA